MSKFGKKKADSIFPTKTSDVSNNLDETNYAIIVNKISKRFKNYHEKNETLFSILTNMFSKRSYDILNVLQDITFNLKKGEMLGIIGLNGSGKTTLLKILSGIIKADSGQIKINGTIAPLLQLGVGFNGELTARENIILSGMLLGFSKLEIKNKVDEIIKFAELEKFVDTKIKNFSSGMYIRLAFSTAIQIDPDILLVDEVLAVGDINFVKKSYNEFLSFKEKGKSIIFVSHSLEHIRNLCDRAMVLESGVIKIIGSVDDAIQYYTGTNTK
jgi:lipopolysaccharide transport system ATP-binding protein